MGCGYCAEECPYDALELSGRLYTLEQAEEEVMKDRAFFDKSGGGVTLSGGEVLMQAGFAVELAARLAEKGIHIACETTAALPLDLFKRLLDVADYIMVDIKHYDAETLWNVCRADFNVICGNIREAVKRKKPLVGRIPVIPGFNDSMKDMEGFAKLGRSLGIGEFHLLPFHQLGEEKYEQLQQEYRMKGVPSLHGEDMEEYAKYLKTCGFHIQIGG